MSTTELLLRTSFEGRVQRTLQSYFRRPNDVLLRESLIATGLTEEEADSCLELLNDRFTVSEIMYSLRQGGTFRRYEEERAREAAEEA
ncbi:hypothetical protein [Brevibacillus dissolubilis]|uniref:hypothetical protein n=1 Tax=Brevibacillus dissolubilis TaxID=1844116 RepID=UPI001116CD1B|nr:hypothetical protein [Brevibacillus dissolubilis]